VISDAFGASLVFSWGIDCIQGKILSSYRLPLKPPNFQDMLVSVQGSLKFLRNFSFFKVQSHVKVNEIFQLAVTVTNLSDTKRELRLIIPAQNWTSVLDAVQPVDRQTSELEHKVKFDREQREKELKVTRCVTWIYMV
jgi:hypothetical protein